MHHCLFANLSSAAIEHFPAVLRGDSPCLLPLSVHWWSLVDLACFIPRGSQHLVGNFEYWSRLVMCHQGARWANLQRGYSSWVKVVLVH